MVWLLERPRRLPGPLLVSGGLVRAVTRRRETRHIARIPRAPPCSTLPEMPHLTPRHPADGPQTSTIWTPEARRGPGAGLAGLAWTHHGVVPLEQLRNFDLSASPVRVGWRMVLCCTY